MASASMKFGRVMDQLIEHAAGLGMDQQHAAEPLALLQRVEDRAVVGLPTFGGVDHELLEGRAAHADHLFHFGAVTVPVGDGHVETVIHAGFGFGFGEPNAVGVFQALLAVGNGEVDEGGDAAAGRGAGAGVPVVAGHRAAEGQLQVYMDVEAARDDVFAGGIHDGRAGAR